MRSEFRREESYLHLENKVSYSSNSVGLDKKLYPEAKITVAELIKRILGSTSPTIEAKGAIMKLVSSYLPEEIDEFCSSWKEFQQRYIPLPIRFEFISF